MPLTLFVVIRRDAFTKEGLRVKLRWFAFLVVLLAGCSSKQDYRNPDWNPEVPVKRAMQWMPITEKAGAAWGVDPKLITAMIAVESGGNPALVSKSNAVGLMQLKASTAGREVYQRMGWKGEPTTSELKNPERNISMGAAYLSILEHGPLAGITNPQVMQYALVVSYVNGAGALLRTFSSDRKKAINEINDLSANEFFDHIVENHPAPQAPRYIWKVQKAINAM
jgi:membrane-bound lytic murein transglycosylase E